LYPFNCKAILIEPGMHMTEFTRRENYVNWIAETWRKADPAVRKEYGEKYFNHSQSMFGS